MPKVESVIPLESGEWLCSVTDVPDHAPKGRIVFCHGFTGNRLGPQKILHFFSKELCASGYLVTRFDFRCSGDSSGSFCSTSFQNMCRDLNNVITWQQAQFQTAPLILIGLSLGGVPVVSVLPDQKSCIGVILLSSDLLDRPIFENITESVSIRDGQFYLNKRFYDERSQISPRQILKDQKKKAFLFYGENDEKMCRAADEMQLFGVQNMLIKSVDHLFETCAARRQVAKMMIQTLNKMVDNI